MEPETVIVWGAGDAEAYNTIRGLMQQAKYKWSYMKLDRVRWYLLREHTIRVPFQLGTPYITNGEVYWK